MATNKIYKPRNVFRVYGFLYLFLFIIILPGFLFLANKQTTFDTIMYWFQVIALVSLFLSWLLFLWIDITIWHAHPIIHIQENRVLLGNPGEIKVVLTRKDIEDVLSKEKGRMHLVILKLKNPKRFMDKQKWKFARRPILSIIRNYLIFKKNHIPIKLSQFFSKKKKDQKYIVWQIWKFNIIRLGGQFWFFQTAYLTQYPKWFKNRLRLENPELVHDLRTALVE